MERGIYIQDRGTIVLRVELFQNRRRELSLEICDVVVKIIGRSCRRNGGRFSKYE